MARSEIGMINTRFFRALAQLIELRRVGSMMGFCYENNVDRGNLYRARREPDAHTVPIHLFGVIVERYGISGDWLLSGCGAMWRTEPLGVKDIY